MTDLFLYLAWLAVLAFTNIFWYLQCKKKDDEWLALLKRHTEDWSELIEEILKRSDNNA